MRAKRLPRRPSLEHLPRWRELLPVCSGYLYVSLNIIDDYTDNIQSVDAVDQGTSVVVQFTDLYLAGAGSQNISLSHQAFAVLAPLEVGTIFPVDWIFVS
jgi:hypothetical protein